MKVLRGFLLTAGVILVLAGIAFYLRPLDFYDDFTYLQQAFHGVENRWAWVDGHRMHYELEGPANGQPIVLVHGLGGRAENWRALAPYFARAGYRVYMPDLIGYGRSEQPRNFSYSIRDEAALVVAFFDAVGLKQVDLGGWSMGGWIVQVAAFDHPERIKRLMIFDSAGLNAPPAWDTRLFTPINIDQLTALDALLMPHPPTIPRFIADDILRTSRDTNWVVSRAMEQMWTGRDVTDSLLPQLKMPVLIEWGAQDRIIPEVQAEKIHRLVPQSQLHVYAGCGHLAPLQCADEMGPNVLRYLQQTPASRALPVPDIATRPTLAEPRPKHIPTEAVRLEAATASGSAAQASGSVVQVSGSAAQN